MASFPFSPCATPLARRGLLALLAGATRPARAAPAARLNRAELRPTLDEDFSHFAASPSGLRDGRGVWRTTFIGGDRTLPANHEVQWYGDAGPDGPFRSRPGGLEITAAPATGLPPGLTHRSGLITSERLLAQRYGYFEIRAQLPRGRGLWPAFWLLPSNGAWPPEIDVMEMLGAVPDTYYVALHAVPGGRPADEVAAIVAPDLSAGYHSFGVAWRADRLGYYLDDRLVHQSATPANLHTPMYMLANLAVGGAGSWPGAAAPDAAGVYRIAWIRAWQFTDAPG